jgi:hypothetical protein
MAVSSGNLAALTAHLLVQDRKKVNDPVDLGTLGKTAMAGDFQKRRPGK